MAAIHISEAEAIRDFPGLLARAHQGEEIVIEKESAPAIVLRKAAEPKGRLLSKSIRLAERRSEEFGHAPAMDPEFAADMNEIIRNRKSRDTSAWD